MVEPSYVQGLIEAGLECDLVKIVGDGQHFEGIIVSSAFVGKNRVQQHQLVYKALGSQMGNEIHALSMKTFTPEVWESEKSNFNMDL